MLKAIKSKVLCKVTKDDRKTEGGILLPDVHTKDWVINEIVSLGSDVTSDLKVGDNVLISGFQGALIEHQGVEYRIYEEDHILVVVEEI